jgi:hypothetical protein
MGCGGFRHGAIGDLSRVRFVQRTVGFDSIACAANAWQKHCLGRTSSTDATTKRN